MGSCPAVAAQDPGGTSPDFVVHVHYRRSPKRCIPARRRSPRPPSPFRPLQRQLAESRGSDYSQLSRLIRQAGLMERRPGHYAWLITITVFLLAAGWAGFVLVGDSWWQLAVAAFLAIVFTQIGFLGHDAGHKQISGSRRFSDVLGLLLGNLGIGLSYGWWVGKHNRHHAHPNTEGADPDIAIGALAFTAQRSGRQRAPGAGPVPLPGLPLLPAAVRRGVELARGRHPRADETVGQEPAGRRRRCSPLIWSATWSSCSWCCRR